MNTRKKYNVIYQLYLNFFKKPNNKQQQAKKKPNNKQTKQQRINLKNRQATPAAQFQKNK